MASLRVCALCILFVLDLVLYCSAGTPNVVRRSEPLKAGFAALIPTLRVEAGGSLTKPCGTMAGPACGSMQVIVDQLPTDHSLVRVAVAGSAPLVGSNATFLMHPGQNMALQPTPTATAGATLDLSSLGFIYVPQGASLALNEVFIVNGANNNAGGCLLTTGGTLIIENALFENCIANQGGALAISTSSNVTIRNTQFLNNRALAYNTSIATGGAILLQSNTFVLEDSFFQGNGAFTSYVGTTAHGGALYAQSLTEMVTIRNCTFMENGAVSDAGDSVDGGAVTVVITQNTITTLAFEYCVFYGNTARSSSSLITTTMGGAVYVANALSPDDTESSAMDAPFAVGVDSPSSAQVFAVSFVVCLFEKNYVYGAGGALGLLHSPVIAHGCVFKYNYAAGVAGGVFGGSGGAIVSSGAQSFLQVDGNSMFLNNSAVSGAATSGADAGGEAGAIYVQKGSALLEDSVFQWNTASGQYDGTQGGGAGSGGALQIASSVVYMQRCTFTANEATSGAGSNIANGGAVMLQTSEVTIESCTFENNMVEGLGGAIGVIASSGMMITVTSSTFRGNIAKPVTLISGGQGGAVLLQGGNATFTDCVFDGNAALPLFQSAGGGSGGAVWVDADATSLFVGSQCAFVGNGAGGGQNGTTQQLNGDGGGVIQVSELCTFTQTCALLQRCGVCLDDLKCGWYISGGKAKTPTVFGQHTTCGTVPTLHEASPGAVVGTDMPVLSQSSLACCPALCSHRGKCTADGQCHCSSPFYAGRACEKFSVTGLGVVIGCTTFAVLMVSVALLLLYRRRQRRLLRARSEFTMRLLNEVSTETSDGHAASGLLPSAGTCSVDHRDVTIGDVVGSGSFGVVRCATWRGSKVAVKTISVAPHCVADTKTKANGHDGDHNQDAVAWREVAFMAGLRHPNLCLLMGVWSSPESVNIVTEFCEGGSLFEVLENVHTNRVQPPTWAQRLTWGKDTARGLAFLHGGRPPIAHRDMKSLNVLMDGRGVCKIADFGTIKVVRHLTTPNTDDDGGSVSATLTRGTDARDRPSRSFGSSVGTVQWAAPEVLMGTLYDHRVDVYSFAMILVELCTLRHPWWSGEGLLSVVSVKKRVIGGERPPVYFHSGRRDPSDHGRGHVHIHGAANTSDVDNIGGAAQSSEGDGDGTEIPPELLSLIRACWQQEPRSRPSMADVLQILEGPTLAAQIAAPCGLQYRH